MREADVVARYGPAGAGWLPVLGDWEEAGPSGSEFAATSAPSAPAVVTSPITPLVAVFSVIDVIRFDQHSSGAAKDGADQNDAILGRSLLHRPELLLMDEPGEGSGSALESTNSSETIRPSVDTVPASPTNDEAILEFLDEALSSLAGTRLGV